MKFTCEINMDNAAFEDDPDAQLSWVLQGIRAAVLRGERESGVVDYNGNTVGSWSIRGEVS